MVYLTYILVGPRDVEAALDPSRTGPDETASQGLHTTTTSISITTTTATITITTAITLYGRKYCF